MEEKKKDIYLQGKITVWILSVITAILVLYIGFSGDLKNYRSHLVSKFTAKALTEQPLVKVTYLYVGQGDATIVQSFGEEGKVMLIDAGPSPDIDEFMGAVKGRNYVLDTILPFLKKENILKIDYLVPSHKDGDHIGGIPYLLNNFEVGRVFDNGTNYPSVYADKMMEAINEKGIELKEITTGELLPFGEGVNCQLIGPLRHYTMTESVENNTSIVVRVTAGDISYIFPGDIEIPAELDLMDYGAGIQTTVLKVPHHGSSSSSSHPFLDVVLPEVAVISCGRYNRYGLPVFDIIRRYEEKGAEIYRTDRDGHVSVITDGLSYIVRTER